MFEPQSEKIKQTFNETDCKQYFREIQSEKNRHKTFILPSWMKKLNKPTRNFNLQTPSYAKKIKIIMKMKSSASPCPNDAISIILQSYNITITSGKNNANYMERKNFSENIAFRCNSSSA